MTTTLESADGTVVIKELTNGRRLLAVTPTDSNAFVLANEWETSYPIDLIQTMLEAGGARVLCDSIMREEDPNYVARLLENDLLAYFTAEDFAGKQILDFGCGSGASSIILARMFPQAEITGVELFSPLLEVARKRVEHYNLPNVRLYQSQSGTELPPDLGQYDFVIMSAVFEHLLPPERRSIMPQLWSAVREGGYLFINQTPNLHFPVELHTTMLPLINYVPDRVAHKMACRFSKLTEKDETWEQLLRKGIRGATEGEIMRLLPSDPAAPVMLEPGHRALKDRIDLYYATTNPDRLRTIKRIARIFIKGIHAVTGITLVPDLSLAFHKKPAVGDQNPRP